MPRKNIVLIGFMGSGKSMVAKRLAKILKRDMVSLDGLVEAKEGRSVKQIFEESGEAYFRNREKEAVREAAGKEFLVIDCGGGVVLDPQNIVKLKANGILIYLSATPETIRERVKNKKGRPLLNVKDPQKRIDELLKERTPLYAQADYTVVTDKKTVKQVGEEIIHLLTVGASLP